MRRITLLLLMPMIVAPAKAQIVGQPVIVSGTCHTTSGVTIDEGDLNEFECDSAVIARTERGTIMIQFLDKTGDDGRSLSFAGTIEGKQGFGADPVQMIAVERLYLAGGADPITASAGTCIMNWSGLQRTGGKIISIVCGARVKVEGQDVKAVVALEAN